MDYEELYQQMQLKEKGLRDTLSRSQKTLKSVAKNAEKGDLKSLEKDLALLEGHVSEYNTLLADLRSLTEGFDAQAYMQNGDFAKQMLAYCDEKSVDVKGDYPVYEMFPYKVEIDGVNQEININRKKTQCVRPLYFVQEIKQNHEKLMKASFNAQTFLSELADAYTILSERKNKASQNPARELDISLRDIYKYMVPMQRFRREYDMQSFAFDLARLYSSGVEYTKDGQQYQFGSVRNNSNAIRILDKNGKEASVATIKFFAAEQQ